MTVSGLLAYPRECEAKEGFRQRRGSSLILQRAGTFLATKIKAFSRRLGPAHLITLDVLREFIAVGRSIRKDRLDTVL